MPFAGSYPGAMTTVMPGSTLVVPDCVLRSALTRTRSPVRRAWLPSAVVNLAAVATVSAVASGAPAPANAARIAARAMASDCQSATLPSAFAAASSCEVVIALVVNGARPLVVAESVTAPVVVVTPLSAFLIDASTSLPTSLMAIERPIETATPTVPPRATATEAAAAIAEISEESVAVSVTLAAPMPVAPSPSTYAWISEAIRFSE